jgi:hypothetical protein
MSRAQAVLARAADSLLGSSDAAGVLSAAWAPGAFARSPHAQFSNHGAGIDLAEVASARMYGGVRTH